MTALDWFWLWMGANALFVVVCVVRGYIADWRDPRRRAVRAFLRNGQL